MASGEFLNQKWAKLFQFFNQSDSGRLTLREFMLTPTEFIKTGKVDSGARLATVYKELWEGCLEAVGRPTNLQTIEKDEFIKGVSFLSREGWVKTKAIPAIVDTYVGLMDKNEDGRIDIDEWRKYYRLKGIDSEDFVQNTFRKMDTNGDGFITREEFANAMNIFVFGDDPENDYSFLYKRK